MKNIPQLLVLFTAFSCLIGCQETEESTRPGKTTPSSPLFEWISAEQSGLAFTNQIEPTFEFNILDYNYFYNGGGIAAADFNGDSLLDLYFTGNMTSSSLYLNRGGLQFEDITVQAGVGTEFWGAGASVVDINLDGWPDIYISMAGYPDAAKRRNKLFVNQGLDDAGIPVFKEEAEKYGIADDGYSTQAAFFDYDLDGDLDMYLATVHHDKRNPNLPRPKVSDGSTPSNDRLYHNHWKENGGALSSEPLFTDVSKKAGILHEGYGLGLAIADINRDGWPDVFVSNDFIFNDLLYINNQNGTFTEQASHYFRHQSRFSMGTDIADFDNDGWQDIMVLDMLPDDNLRQKQMNTAMNYDFFQLALERDYQPQYSRNVLQRNNGKNLAGELSFSEIGQLAGIDQTDWSWSVLFADFDLDGQRDLFISNGIPKDITDSDFIMYRDQEVGKGNFNYETLKQKLLERLENLPSVDKSNYMFKNEGNWQFSNQSVDWGLQRPSFSHGAVAADLDNDGDVDLVCNNLSQQAYLYKNTAVEKQKGRFIHIKLNGSAINPSGQGAKVQLIAGKQTLFAEYSTVHGFQSSQDAGLHFGVGNAPSIDSLHVLWPDGKAQWLTDISTNQTLTLDYQHAISIKKETPTKPVPASSTWLQPITQNLPATYQHEENPFIDFKFEPLLPRKYSQIGPTLAVGDVNGDGLDDFFTGGSVKKAGQLFLQRGNGKFYPTAFPDENYEDTGALFFDADNDGDVDLYVVSGGVEFNAGTATYQDRLYRNDGDGKFEKDADALPKIYSSGGCVTAADYDQDGDLDLFVAGRISPGRYPTPAYSAILRNEGGTFVNATEKAFPPLKKMGLVSTALWTDFNADGQVDLLLAGEWMPLTFLQNNKGTFTDVTDNTGLENTNGLWNSLASGDFDQDGDIDYIAGNLGLNSRLKAKPQEPLTLYAKDFDRNGSLDAVLGYYQEDEKGERQLFPIPSRDALIDQMVPIRKQFPTYLSYAQAPLNALFPEKDLKSALKLEAKHLASSYIENLGDGKFNLRPLPIEAQVAPIYGVLIRDFTKDGIVDVLLTGNSYATEFVTGWHDAFNGLLLQGDGKGNFNRVESTKSGFYVDGDGKSLAQLRTIKDRQLVLAAQHEGSLLNFYPPFVGKVIPIRPNDAYALITLTNGKHYREELHYGSGYLSQSARALFLPNNVEKVTVVDFTGQSREL